MMKYVYMLIAAIILLLVLALGVEAYRLNSAKNDLKLCKQNEEILTAENKQLNSNLTAIKTQNIELNAINEKAKKEQEKINNMTFGTTPIIPNSASPKTTEGGNQNEKNDPVSVINSIIFDYNNRVH